MNLKQMFESQNVYLDITIKTFGFIKKNKNPMCAKLSGSVMSFLYCISKIHFL